MSVINVRSFGTQWNASNIHLSSDVCAVWKHSDKPVFEKIFYCAWKGICVLANFFLTPFKRICASIVVPASNESLEERARCEEIWSERWSHPEHNPSMADLIRTYEPTKLQVQTPDGARVEGAFYKHRRAENRDVPTIVCFNPNGGLAKGRSWDWLLNKGKNSPIPFNVVVFDYRFHAMDQKECVLDGDAVIQALHGGMQISKRNLHMLGYSFGGGIGALTRQLHSDAGNYVNLRSFRSISDVAKHSPQVSSFIPGCLRGGPIGFCVKAIISGLVSMLNWNIDTSEAFEAMRQRALVVHHPDDRMIPGPASPAELVDAERVVQMRFKSTVVNPSESYPWHHVEGLECYEDQNGLNITKRILNFLLETDHFRQRKPQEERARRHLFGNL